MIHEARSVIQLNEEEARTFLLKSESYFNLELPPYFTFETVLSSVSDVLSSKPIRDFQKSQPKAVLDGINHKIFANKDGRFSWRPYQLIHPAVYVSLVNDLTTADNWAYTTECFKEFTCEKIHCLSLPIESTGTKKDKEVQILNWWQSVEQKSIELALDFNHLTLTDIVDCYGSIYTHSVAWALHGREFAKEKWNDKSLIGNAIDATLSGMNSGQTIGIPQGSVLMDIIAEIVLGSIDKKLEQKLVQNGITEFTILRYRDDYRIFTKDSQSGEFIIKILTEILLEYGLKINSSKTKTGSDLISLSIKEDKLASLLQSASDVSLQKQLIRIHQFAITHPNSGSLLRALSDFYRQLCVSENPENPIVLASIAADIAFHNPRVYPVTAAILSQAVKNLDLQMKRSILSRVRAKFERIPNTCYLDIWLQRISHSIDPNINYNTDLCNVVSGNPTSIWINKWLSSKKLTRTINPNHIIDREILENLDATVAVEEFSLFIARSVDS